MMNRLLGVLRKAFLTNRMAGIMLRVSWSPAHSALCRDSVPRVSPGLLAAN